MVELKVYSEAFFEIAKEQDQINKYEQEAQAVLAVLNENEDLRKVLVHPEIAVENKFKLLKELFENRISGDFIGLFNVILMKRRETALINILEGFLKLVNQYNKITKATVYTPISIAKEQQEQIISSLSNKLDKKVTLDIVIEPKLVAGLKIVADGAVLDVSIARQMANLKHSTYSHLAKEVV